MAKSKRRIEKYNRARAIKVYGADAVKIIEYFAKLLSGHYQYIVINEYESSDYPMSVTAPCRISVEFEDNNLQVRVYNFPTWDSWSEPLMVVDIADPSAIEQVTEAILYNINAKSWLRKKKQRKHK